MNYYGPHLGGTIEQSKGRNIAENYGNYGVNWDAILQPGVKPYNEMPAMQELAKFEPIDEVRHVFGIMKDQINLPTAYLGKGLRKHPKYVDIVDQYMEYVVGFPGFKSFLEKSDYDPVVREDPADKALLVEMQTKEREEEAKQEKIGEIAAATGSDAAVMEAALKLLFPNGLPNAEQLAGFQQLQAMIGATNKLANDPGSTQQDTGPKQEAGLKDPVQPEQGQGNSIEKAPVKKTVSSKAKKPAKKAVKRKPASRTGSKTTSSSSKGENQTASGTGEKE